MMRADYHSSVLIYRKVVRLGRYARTVAAFQRLGLLQHVVVNANEGNHITCLYVKSLDLQVIEDCKGSLITWKREYRKSRTAN